MWFKVILAGPEVPRHALQHHPGPHAAPEGATRLDITYKGKIILTGEINEGQKAENVDN